MAALGREFGEERVLRVIQETIVSILAGRGSTGAGHGRRLALKIPGVPGALDKGHALEIDVLEEGIKYSPSRTRCRYAEMYRELGIPQTGPDPIMFEGFCTY